MLVTPDSDSQSSTRTLIQRGRAGDGSAWDRVFGRVIDRLRRWAHGRLPQSARGAHETVDVVQDAAAGVWKRMDQLDLRRPGDLEAYVRQAVINRIRDEARKGYARPRAVELEDRYVDDAPSPLGEVLSKEAWERYQQAFAALDVTDREAVIARVDMGYSYEQVAAITGKSTAGAARMAVTRALERLRAAIDGPSA
jgi:RNA polymerase sigma-70 factor (ECF subfamily)